MKAKPCILDGCNNPRWSHKYCKYHQYLWKENGGKTLQRTPIRQVSKKQAIINIEYQKERVRYLNKHKYCEYAGCSHSATQIHHKQGRGNKTLDTTTWMAVCISCHNYIHANPKIAIEKGYLINRNVTVQ